MAPRLKKKQYRPDDRCGWPCPCWAQYRATLATTDQKTGYKRLGEILRRLSDPNRERAVQRARDRRRIARLKKDDPEAYRARRAMQNRAGKRVRRRNRHAAEGSHTEADVRALRRNQKGRCHWCGNRLPTQRRHWNVDHVIPISRGGRDSPPNLVAACRRCNKDKSDLMPWEYYLRFHC